MSERPRTTETADKEQEPSIDFKGALLSLIGYSSIEAIPRVMFRKLNEIRLSEGITEDDAAERIFQACQLATVDDIRKRLAKFQPYQPSAAVRRSNFRVLDGRSALEA